jgi:uncharacterized protein (TIGR03435 family)
MKLALAALSTALAVLAQGPQFEVASVRPSTADTRRVLNQGLHLDGAQARINALLFRDHLALAYNVRIYQIAGPDWIATDRFDINARLPAQAKEDQIPGMLQALLAERFGLKVHREKRPFQVFALARGTKPLLLVPAAPQGDAEWQGTMLAASGTSSGFAVNLGGGASYAFGGNKFEAKRLTMAQLVDVMGAFVNLPVVDATGLGGLYDLTLELAPDDFTAMLLRAARMNGSTLPPEVQRLADTATTPSLFEALEKLGLKLETRRLPMEVIVVDQAWRTPTEN